MDNYDSLDYQICFLSTKDNQKNSYILEEPFDFEINESNKENKTQLNNMFFTPYNSEQLDSPNIDMVQQNLNNINTNKVSPQNLANNPNPQPETKKNKLLGRKKKDSGEKGAHNKYSEDNIIRKIKQNITNALRIFINLKIKENLDLSKITVNGTKHKKMEIIKINQDQVVDSNVENNKKLLTKKIKEYFSVERSGNFSKYPNNFNELLIQKLYEIDNDKKMVGILEMTFLESLRYYRMDEDIMNDPNYFCLKGLENSFLEFKNELLEDNDELYYDKLIYYIKNFETIILKKKGRAKRKKVE